MRRYLTRVFRLTGRATGVQQANQRSVTSAPVNITVKPPSGEPQVEPLMGWGGETLGAWSHPTEDPVILKVTNLSNDENEEGSLFWALSQEYPRIIVFEVGGVIDMEWKNYGFGKSYDPSYGRFDIINPYLTVAGQTAPSPGITIIRGGLWIFADHIIFQHIKIRTGEHPEPDGNRMDAFTIRGNNDEGQSDILVDHCSFTWGTRYTVSAFAGNERDGRWKRTRRVTFSNNIVAEAITQPEGNLGVGGVFSAGEIVVARNLWAYNLHRNPNMVDTHGILLNNFLSGMVESSSYNGLELSYIGNMGIWADHDGLENTHYGVYRHHSHSDIKIFAEDNLRYNPGWEIVTPFYTISARDGTIIWLDEKEQWHESLDNNIISTDNLLEHIENNVGARPWDRDSIDQRIVSEAINTNGALPYGKGPEGWEPPDGGIQWDESWYPDHEPTHRYYNSDEWEWHDGKQGLTDEKRVLINKATGSYAHPDDL